MAGQAQLGEWRARGVESVAQLGGRGGEQEQCAHHDSGKHAHRIEHGRPRTAGGYRDWPRGEKHAAVANEQQVEDRKDEKHPEHAPHGREDLACRDARRRK